VSPLLRIADLALRFGRVNRATFHPDGVRPETDTDHTVMLVLLALHIADAHPELGLNLGTLALLGAVHDLPEAYAGDTNTLGGLTPAQRADKFAREQAAIQRIDDELQGGPIVQAMLAYERKECPEARFLAYLDKITPRYTHARNGGASPRKRGYTAKRLGDEHWRQGAELAALYPEFAAVLGPLFDAACAESEAALAESLRKNPPVSARTATNRLNRAYGDMDQALEACAGTIESRHPDDMRAAARQMRDAVEKFEAAIGDFEEAHTVRVPA
jgi:5'-deoxynucleotidase YfbR-like HD superfamily hydrolase